VHLVILLCPMIFQIGQIRGELLVLDRQNGHIDGIAYGRQVRHVGITAILGDERIFDPKLRDCNGARNGDCDNDDRNCDQVNLHGGLPLGKMGLQFASDGIFLDFAVIADSWHVQIGHGHSAPVVGQFCGFSLPHLQKHLKISGVGAPFIEK